MIGYGFVKHLRQTPSRLLPRVNLFTRYMDGKIQDATRRASYLTPNGNGARVLVEIIKLSDLDVLLNIRDSGKLVDYLLPIVKDLEKPIDVRVGKHTARSLFIQSKTPCFELITASRRKNPLLEIPVGDPYNSASWANIRPLRICDMGPADLKYHLYQESLVYSRRGPTHAIYSVDCFALVAKFVAYYQAQNFVSNLDQCLWDYVHNEVIVPNLINDSFSLWLRNTYKQQFLNQSPLESHTSTLWDNVTTDTIGSDFTGAMVDIQNLRNDLQNQSITDHTVFSSLVMTASGETFVSYYKDLFHTTLTPDEQQYVWVDCLKHLNWWEFILTICSLAPDLPDVISFKRQVLRDVRLWRMMAPWNMVHSSVPYRTIIRSRLDGMYDYLNNE